MNLIERVQALVYGKKIRRTEWDEESYFKLIDGQILDENNHNQGHMNWAEKIFETGGEWELYEESPPSSLPLERRMGNLECFVKQQVLRTDNLEERLTACETHDREERGANSVMNKAIIDRLQTLENVCSELKISCGFMEGEIRELKRLETQLKYLESFERQVVTNGGEVPRIIRPKQIPLGVTQE